MTSSIGKLKGLVALVTGGASGLGRATVERFVREGSKVVVCDLPVSTGQDVADDLGGSAVFVPTDVCSECDVVNALDVVKKEFDRLDVVVNCAGIYLGRRTYNPERDTVHSLDQFQKVLQINLVGTFNVVRLAAQLMSKNDPNADGQRGVVVNTASIAAMEGVNGTAAYSASKAGVVSLTLPLARDLANIGIRVNSIAPGYFDTPILSFASEDNAKSVPFPKRFGLPDEYSHLVQYIVENPMLNGETIRLDGALRFSGLYM